MGAKHLLLCFAVLATAPPALAQTSVAPAQGAQLTFEGRFGALWPQSALVIDWSDIETSTTQPVVGFRMGWHFTKAFDRRLNLQFVFDYAPLGSTEYADPYVGSMVQREGHWYAITPAFAVDVVKTPRFVVDAHAGPSVVGEYKTFLLERSNQDCYYNYASGTTTCEGPYENVCGLAAYRDRCEDHWRTVLGIGAGARWYVRPSWYVGLDYTWLSHGRHVLVGTVGIR